MIQDFHHNINGLHCGICSQQDHSAIMVASGSVYPHFKREGWRFKARCKLPGTKSGDDEESVSCPLFSEMPDYLRNGRIFTKTGLRCAHNLIRIMARDEYKRVFRTPYTQFQFLVVPFCLTDSPVTFQPYINESLHPQIDDFVVCYLDIIPIY
jgi:hypothetical protein